MNFRTSKFAHTRITDKRACTEAMYTRDAIMSTMKAILYTYIAVPRNYCNT